MRPLLHRRTSCRVCGGRSLEPVLALAPTPPANAFVGRDSCDQPQATYPLELYLCQGCGHVQLLDVMDPFELFQRQRSAIGGLAALSEHFESYAERTLERYRPAVGRLVVGVGSNDGTILKVFQRARLASYGVEPAVDLARAAIADGIRTFPGFFSPGVASRIEDEAGRAAIIIAPNVLTHADDLVAFLEAVSLLLARDGIFTFEVDYLGDLIGHGIFDVVRHECPHLWAVAPLRRLFLSCDLELFAVERTGGPRGRLRGVVQHLGGPHAPDGSVQRMMAEERRLGFGQPAAVRALRDRIQALKAEIAGGLEALKRDGRTIAGYGAPARATTLMHELDLDRRVLDFVVDDNAWKQGLFTPGLHVPILHPRAVSERRPDWLVILAWDFAEAIIERLTAFRAAGGRILVPLPELRLL